MEFFLLEGDGTRRAELGSHPGAEEFYYLDETVFPPFSFWMLDPPFQQTVVWGAWDGLAIVSPSDRDEIRAYGPEGTLQRIVRRDHAVRLPTEADLESYRNGQLESIRGSEYREMMAPVLGALEVPPSFPAFSAIEVDAVGYLWVREYDLPGQERDRALWTVFDPGGIVQGFIGNTARPRDLRDRRGLHRGQGLRRTAGGVHTDLGVGAVGLRGQGAQMVRCCKLTITFCNVNIT